MTRRGAAHLFAAVSYLFGPAFMVWVWVDFESTDRDPVFVAVFVVFAAVFFWHGFGWSIHHLRQAARHRHR